MQSMTSIIPFHPFPDAWRVHLDLALFRSLHHHAITGYRQYCRFIASSLQRRYFFDSVRLMLSMLLRLWIVGFMCFIALPDWLRSWYDKAVTAKLPFTLWDPERYHYDYEWENREKEAGYFTNPSRVGTTAEQLNTKRTAHCPGAWNERTNRQILSPWNG